MYKVLIVEDDLELSALFTHVLEKSGYSVTQVSDGLQALEELGKSYYDTVISDVMMPVMDGCSLIRELRKSGSTVPVLIITAKDSFEDMQDGFAAGTDDYMVKPVNVNEIVLRVGALIRRAQIANERRIVIGSTVLECDSLTVTCGGEKAVLPQKEFMLLYKMASYPGKIFTRQQLIDEIWGYEADGDTHTVDVHIGRLRDRFKDCEDFRIVTMRGLGYKVVKA